MEYRNKLHWNNLNLSSSFPLTIHWMLVICQIIKSHHYHQQRYEVKKKMVFPKLNINLRYNKSKDEKVPEQKVFVFFKESERSQTC